MANRMLEAALGTSPISSMKAACKTCEKRHLCHRIADVLGSISVTEVNVWDLEHQLRYRSLMKELGRLGYEFPEGYALCEVSKMSRKEVTELLREAQELLIEIKDVRPEDEEFQRRVT